MEAIKARFDGRNIILPAQFNRTTPGDVVVVFEENRHGPQAPMQNEHSFTPSKPETDSAASQSQSPIDRSQDPLFTDFEVFEDDWPSDVSSNIDKYLHEDWVKRKLQ